MIYVHIPFCRSFCTYCSFYSELSSKSGSCHGEAFDRFADAVCAEIRGRADEASATGEVNTLYIGGGTPSVLPLSVLSRIVCTLSDTGCSGFDEFTVEVNPDDIVAKGREYVEGLAGLGVNRVSMGVQSFDDGVLKWMNRRHDASAAVQAYSVLRDGGIDNISIDLIFGLGDVQGTMPLEGRWARTIEKALAIAGDGSLPHHISAYQLSVEDGSVLAGLSASGRWKEASEDECSSQYALLCRKLSEAGYHHYEISNFALPGYEARHNSAYWRHFPYAGFGPGAHSFTVMDGRPVRKWNDPDLKSYLAAAASGRWNEASGYEVLTDEQVAMERIMLGLRTDKGVERSLLETGTSSGNVAELLRSGHIAGAGGDFLRIPEEHFFISDSIIAGLV